MKRRQFITLLGTAAAWPLAARAQQPAKSYRIGYLALLPGEDTTLMKPLLERLQELGYAEGKNTYWIHSMGCKVAACEFLEARGVAVLRAPEARDLRETTRDAAALRLAVRGDELTGHPLYGWCQVRGLASDRGRHRGGEDHEGGDERRKSRVRSVSVHLCAWAGIAFLDRANNTGSGQGTSLSSRRRSRSILIWRPARRALPRRDSWPIPLSTCS